MFAQILDFLLILLGLSVTLLGLLFVLKPDSEWVRLMRRIPEDVILDDIDLLSIKVRGLIGFIVGAIMIAMSVLHLLV